MLLFLDIFGYLTFQGHHCYRCHPRLRETTTAPSLAQSCGDLCQEPPPHRKQTQQDQTGHGSPGDTALLSPPLSSVWLKVLMMGRQNKSEDSTVNRMDTGGRDLRPGKDDAQAATKEEQQDGTQLLRPQQCPVCLVLPHYLVLHPASSPYTELFMPCTVPGTKNGQKDADTVSLKAQNPKEKSIIKKISDEKKAVWSQGLAVNHMGASQAAPQQYLHSECNEPKPDLVGSFYSGSKKRYLCSGA